MKLSDFSILDLVEFGVIYFEILGFDKFSQTFIKPLGKDIMTEITQKIHLKTSLTNKSIFLTTSYRFKIFEKILFSKDLTKYLDDGQIPADKTHLGLIFFNDIHKKNTATELDKEIIQLIVEAYVSKFGYESFLNQVIELIYSIFGKISNQLKELFNSHKQKIDYLSINGFELESVKTKATSEFLVLDKNIYQPFILLTSQIEEFTTRYFRFSYKIVIFQEKTYFDFKSINPNWLITSDIQAFSREIQSIKSNQLPIRINFLHKKPRKKTEPDTYRKIIENMGVAANSNERIRRRA